QQEGIYQSCKPVANEKTKEQEMEKESARRQILDLRTLAWALFNEPFSLKKLCEELKTKHQKFDHEPTGKVTIEEIDYARQDGRCTVDALNALKHEFDKHPIELPHPTSLPLFCGRTKYQKCCGRFAWSHTRGLLQRAHVLAGEIRYVGKETERKWEEGDELSILEFKTSEYGRSNKVIATEDVKTKILKIGI